MALPLPEAATFAEFARLANYKRSYVKQLGDAGRLVLTDDKQRVRVAESLQLIEDTRDPAKAAVAARHAAQRAAGATAAATPAPAAPEAAAGDDGDSEGLAPATGDGHATRRSRALAVKEEAAARKALRDEQLELGQLLVADQVVAVVGEAATALRQRLEALAFELAPQLAALSDEGQVRTRLSSEFEHALGELSRRFAVLGRKPER